MQYNHAYAILNIYKLKAINVHPSKTRIWRTCNYNYIKVNNYESKFSSK